MTLKSKCKLGQTTRSCRYSYRDSDLTATEKVTCVKFITDGYADEAQNIIFQNAAGVLREFAQDLQKASNQEKILEKLDRIIGMISTLNPRPMGNLAGSVFM
ncbi:hypothetical protein DFA_02883 [Cavenderia fasciculata]|uniref:Uncharacterized protein n=1 Tax=Cavenderia fasciculata TaxID=261658 RepID=F4PIR0_CACFS|nr:uncharacterized protein DFA_02883 [Cavenderia fasciculata]EGG24639.1 hypothetical protein DFA_02883 [Cavenderia fasciculata]|eukprot:XP_004362490.1 hypothetical protein DFA_02883 [Cavenderia fasciculata]